MAKICLSTVIFIVKKTVLSSLLPFSIKMLQCNPDTTPFEPAKGY